MRFINSKRIAMLVLSFKCFGVLAIQNPKGKIPLDPEVTHGKLKNGFTYYIRKNDNPAGNIRIKLVVKAGYLQETPDQLHLAHVLEHAVLQRTKHFPSAWEFLKERGLQPGKDMNAYTGYSNTRYFFSIPSTRPDVFLDCMHVIRDICQDATLDSMTIDANRGSVVNELGKPTTGALKIYEENHTILGDPKFKTDFLAILKNVQEFEHSSLRKFYHDWYRPDLQGLIVVGDVNVDSTLKMITHLFGDLKTSKNQKKWERYRPQAIIYKDAFSADANWHGEGSVIEFIYRQKGFPLKTKIDYRKKAIIDLYNHMANSRLEEALKSKNQIIVDASCNYTRGVLVSDAGIDALYKTLVLKPDTDDSFIETGLKDFLLEDERIQRYGFTEEELIQAKSAIQMSPGFNPINESVDLEYEYENHFMGKSAAPGSEFLKRIGNDILNSISLTDISTTMKSWTEQPPFIKVNNNPKYESLLPERATILKWEAEVRKMSISPFMKIPDTLKPIMSPAEINFLKFDSRYESQEFKEIGASLFTFKNGVQLLIKPFRASGLQSQKIILESYSKNGGTSRSTEEDYYNAVFSPLAISPGKLTKEDLDAYDQRKKTRISPFVSVNTAGFKGETITDNIELMVQLLHQFITAPKKEEESFNQFLADFSEKKMMVRSADDSIFNKYSGSKALTPSLSEFAKINVDRAWSLYVKSFSNMNDSRFVITGDFDKEKLVPAIFKYLSCLPSDSNIKQSERINIKDSSISGTESYEITEKSKSDVYLSFRFYSSEGDLSLKNRIGLSVLETVLQDILIKKIREDLGATYSLIGFSQIIDNNIFSIGANFRTTNNNIDEIKRAVWNEIVMLKQKGPSSEITNMAVRQQISKLEAGLSDHEFLQSYFYNQFLGDRKIDEIIQWKEELKKITPEKIREFAIKYLNTDRLQKIETTKP